MSLSLRNVTARKSGRRSGCCVCTRGGASESATIKYVDQRTSPRATDWTHGQVPATNNERRRWQRPGRHDQVPATRNERRRGQRPGLNDQVSARRRGNQPGHHDHKSATHNERRRGQQPGHRAEMPTKVTRQRHLTYDYRT